jgi:hypothetical protein
LIGGIITSAISWRATFASEAPRPRSW